MRKSAPPIAAISLLVIFSIFSKVSQSQVQSPDWEMDIDGGKNQRVIQENIKDTRALQAQATAAEAELDREIRRVMEKGGSLEERRRQVPAIAASFALRTEPQRARFLSALCYLKTLGTPFMPIDIAEIALAETGSHGLSGKASSPKGAIGVWQMMPSRAKSHGYTSKEMENDQKCADAAVRELTMKLTVANGNLEKAKKLYCGVGHEADAYELRRRMYRKEILEILSSNLYGKDKKVGFNALALKAREYITD